MSSVTHRARITGEAIADKTILEVDIGPNAVGSTELIKPAVGSANIYNSAVYATKIAANAVGFNKLTAGLQGSLGGMPDSIGTTELMEPAVGSQNIYNGAVYGTKIAANAVGYGKLTTGLQGSLGGMPDTIGTTQLKEPGVGSENIYSGAVYDDKIAANAVGFDKLTTGLQGSLGVVADHSIGSEKLILGSVIISRQVQIGTALISGDVVADAGISEQKLEEHYEHGTITGVRLAGRYKTFFTAFGDIPHVVLTPIGTYDACLVQNPALGSFKVKVSTNGGLSGTANLHFMAWGVRA